jgi:nucleoside-diphosphate-sugar epimerase
MTILILLCQESGRGVAEVRLSGAQKPYRPAAPGKMRDAASISIVTALQDIGAKVRAYDLFFDYYRQNKVQIKVARIFNTYGPRMHPNDGRVVSNFIVQALGRPDHHLR